MVSIMCTRVLRRTIANAGEQRAEVAPQTKSRSGRLGNWAATLIEEGSRLVVAQNERTSLTLIFPFPRYGGFRRAFAATLRDALREYGVAPAVVAEECAEVKCASIISLRNSPIAASLDFSVMETAAHAAGQSLRSIQNMLNTSGLERYIPSEAINTLFRAQGAPKPTAATEGT